MFVRNCEYSASFAWKLASYINCLPDLCHYDWRSQTEVNSTGCGTSVFPKGFENLEYFDFQNIRAPQR